MLILETFDLNDSISDVVLGGVSYRLRLTWNDRVGFWTVYVGDAEQWIRISRVVRNFPLFFGSPLETMPPGLLFCVTKDGKDPDRLAFVEGRAALVYVEPDEVT